MAHGQNLPLHGVKGSEFDEEVEEAEEKPCNGKEEAKKAHEQCTERYEESGESNF